MNRREWATMLGSITSPSFPADGIEALVDMLPLLAEFDDSYFSVQTVKDIAAMKRRQSIPAYDEICSVFGKTRYDRLPTADRLGYVAPQALLEAPRDDAATIEASVARAKELLAEFRAENVRQSPKIEPRYLDKLQLALSATSSVLASRPDYRAALELYRQAKGQRT